MSPSNSGVAKGVAAMRAMGFRDFKVLTTQNLVRLVLTPAELSRALEPEGSRQLILTFKKLGYKFVTLDLEGAVHSTTIRPTR